MVERHVVDGHLHKTLNFLRQLASLHHSHHPSPFPNATHHQNAAKSSTTKSNLSN